MTEKSGAMPNYSKSDCIRAIRLICEELGETVDEETYIRFKDMFHEFDIIFVLLPDIHVVRKLCGSYDEALYLALDENS